MQDLVYYFDKLSPYARHELGEIQADFNMSFTIDGTKDSTKLIVHSYNGVEIEPYTIIKHEKTNTWWCVIKDKVDRYENENNASNEKSFYYIHTITCNGAKELLNARDLIDCGFNANRYVIGTFLERLVSLSKWDFPNIGFIYGDNINEVEVVPFVKTFENYTLYSALREFLDGYNCDFKLWFTQLANGRLNYAYIDIIPKTGNVELDVLQESVFGDVRESKVIEKNSYGTTVVSNAENVISSVAKTYPSQGSAKVSANEYEITYQNAVFRLPSKVYKLNWFKLFRRTPITIKLEHISGTGTGDDHEDVVFIFPTNEDSVNSLATQVEAKLRGFNLFTNSTIESIMSEFNTNIDVKNDKMIKLSTITFYEGNSLNPVSGAIVKGSDVPYIPILNAKMAGEATYKNYQFVIMDKDQRNCLPLKQQGFYWERGSDLIQGFEMFENNVSCFHGEYTDYQNSDTNLYTESDVLGTGGGYNLTIFVDLLKYAISLHHATFSCNYIPMSDLKIEIDNQRSTKDMQLYNQNGRLTDSVALSKILNSYSREISSDKITKYMDFYNFSSIPQAGQMVTIGNELYVINNVSINFFLNENDTYYMPCEFTLCKYVSTKSLMVNPNTNIRDYGIPQNYNVKRKQLYRDYLELSYTHDNNDSGSFYCNTIPFNLSVYGYTPITHTVAFECEYTHQVDGSIFWDYQLETTIYRLDKMHIELLDFKDNNIIGYGSQNTHSAFDVSRIFNGMLDTINTPISYVDENGEVKGFTLCWATNEQISQAWEDYKIDEGYGSNTDYDLTNFSVFIPPFIVGSLAQCDMILNEDEYYKDATEVPVFEYVFQVGDSNEVVVGDKILDNYKEENCVWLYGFVKANVGTLNQINALINANSLVIGIGTGTVSLANAIEFTNNTNNVIIKLWEQAYNSGNNSVGYVGYVAPESGYDYAIYRYKYNYTTYEQVGNPQLVMVLKNVPSSAISYGEIHLYKNKYKLK